MFVRFLVVVAGVLLCFTGADASPTAPDAAAAPAAGAALLAAAPGPDQAADTAPEPGPQPAVPAVTQPEVTAPEPARADPAKPATADPAAPDTTVNDPAQPAADAAADTAANDAAPPEAPAGEGPQAAPTLGSTDTAAPARDTTADDPAQTTDTTAAAADTAANDAAKTRETPTDAPTAAVGEPTTAADTAPVPADVGSNGTQAALTPDLPQPETEEPSAGEQAAAAPETEGAPPAAAARPESGDTVAGIQPEAPVQDAQEPPEAPQGSDGAALAAEPSEEDLFPTYPIVEAQRAFWIQIFTRYHSQEGLLHDSSLTTPVYEAVNLEGLTRRQQYRVVNRRKAAVAATLRQLARDRETGATPDAAGQRLLEMLPHDCTPEDLRRWAADIRFQRGLADRFKKGLIRSGAILPAMRRILARKGVPRDLAYLPHVESSFNPRAYSKFGAAGIWQFTRGTGRIFMDVRYEVDERLDPLIATKAAARFLRQNYEKLGTWPLAITAYNHGPQSMERIVARTGTHDLGQLIETYHGGLFRFASKNFYAEFLAARQVANDYQRYFGDVQLAEPIDYREVQLPFYLAFDDAAQALGVAPERLGRLNPSLRSPVLIGTKYIPKNFSLRVPARVKPKAFLAAIPPEARKHKQKPITEWRVQRGDTLYDLGRRFGISWRLIARANNITRFHRIRPGQRIIIPKPGLVLPPQPSTPVAAVAHVAAPTRLPKGATPGSLADAIAFQKAEGDALLQDLEFRRLDKRRQEGEIVSAFGETLGHYADWAQVSTQEIRNYNGWRYGRTLRPGHRLVVPLYRVNPSTFRERRVEYHQSREEDFFSTYGVTGSVKLKVQPGDSVWRLAQKHNVPMWLFYAQNPKLLAENLRPGMEIKLPVVESLEDLRERDANDHGNGSDSAAAADGASTGDDALTAKASVGDKGGEQGEPRSGSTGAGSIGPTHPAAGQSLPFGMP